MTAKPARSGPQTEEIKTVQHPGSTPAEIDAAIEDPQVGGAGGGELRAAAESELNPG